MSSSNFPFVLIKYEVLWVGVRGGWISHTFYHQPIVLLPINSHWPTTSTVCHKMVISINFNHEAAIMIASLMSSFLLNMLRIILRWHYHLSKFVINSLDNVVAVNSLFMFVFSVTWGWQQEIFVQTINRPFNVEILKYQDENIFISHFLILQKFWIKWVLE